MQKVYCFFFFKMWENQSKIRQDSYKHIQCLYVFLGQFSKTEADLAGDETLSYYYD